jgi:hypothetical protein
MVSVDNSYISVEDHPALRLHNGNVSLSNGGIVLQELFVSLLAFMSTTLLPRTKGDNGRQG